MLSTIDFAEREIQLTLHQVNYDSIVLLLVLLFN